jgi:multidrug transporter EmrE-like cation transporter
MEIVVLKNIKMRLNVLISLSAILLLIVAVISQIAGATFLSLSNGFTNPLYSIASCLCAVVALAVMARLIYSGLRLSMIFPLVSALIPLRTIAIGVIFNGDPASFGRITVLVLACVAIGASSYL